ncbi:hypothetical protein WDJ51_08345 [Rathayibacter sp. YIM 133350]|uniref:hypothetical protein n=1 Tax=Rathayibacter sp. YIM 133350 TaxID=3131992 RepID=UPI00307DD1CC
MSDQNAQTPTGESKDELASQADAAAETADDADDADGGGHDLGAKVNDAQLGPGGGLEKDAEEHLGPDLDPTE